MGAGLRHVRRISVEPMDQVAVARAQCDRHHAIAAAEMDDEAALDARSAEDGPGQVRFGRPGLEPKGQAQNDSSQPGGSERPAHRAHVGLLSAG